MKIGVVGNREGFTYNDVKNVLDKYLPLIDTIVTGGAKGVDTHAMRYAKENGLRLIVCYPDFSLGIPKCFFHRNEQVVKECLEDCIGIVAFNKKDHSGTTNTINIAERYGVRVILRK